MDYRKPLFDLVTKDYPVTFFFWERNRIIQHQYRAHYGKRGTSRKHISLVDIRLFVKCVRESDIVISSLLDSYNSFICLLLCELFKKKLIIWEELSIFHKTWRGYLRLIYYRLFSHFVDCFYVMGDQHALALREIGVASSRIFQANEYPGYVYWQVNPNNSGGISLPRKKIVLCMGRFVKSKGVDVLIRAFGKLQKKRKDVFLLLVGGGPLENYLHDMVQSLQIKNIRFMKPIFNVNFKSYLFHQCAVLVAPSVIAKDEFVEAGPMIVLEALSAGTPVIATIGEHTRYIQNGMNGYVVPQGNVDALCEKMEDVLEWQSQENVRQRVYDSFMTLRDHRYQYSVLQSALDYCNKT